MILISFFILLNHVIAAVVSNRTDRLLNMRNNLKQRTFARKTDISAPSPWILSTDLSLYILEFLDDDFFDLSATCKYSHQLTTRHIENRLPHIFSAPFLSKLLYVITNAKGKLYFLHPFLNIIVSDHLKLIGRPACLSNPVDIQLSNLVAKCAHDPSTYKLVQVLLENDGHRIPPNLSDYAVETALLNHHTDSFKYFLSLKKHTIYPLSLLIKAVRHGNRDSLRHLLSGNTRVKDLDDLLLEAIHFHRNDLVPLLLQKIEIEIETILAFSPDLPVKALSRAISRQNPFALRSILTFPFFQYDHTALESALQATVHISNPEILRILINNAQFSYEALETALDLAVAEMNRNAVMTLLDEV